MLVLLLLTACDRMVEPCAQPLPGGDAVVWLDCGGPPAELALLDVVDATTGADVWSATQHDRSLAVKTGRIRLSSPPPGYAVTGAPALVPGHTYEVSVSLHDAIGGDTRFTVPPGW